MNDTPQGDGNFFKNCFISLLKVKCKNEYNSVRRRKLTFYSIIKIIYICKNEYNSIRRRKLISFTDSENTPCTFVRMNDTP